MQRRFQVDGIGYLYWPGELESVELAHGIGGTLGSGHYIR
jgi:hypothetical protein